MKNLIFKKNLTKHIRTAKLKNKLVRVNNMKYLPAYSKEWKNTVYSFNKTNMKNITPNSVNINKIIRGYFNLFFKDRKFLGKTKFIYLKRRRKSLRRIFVSDANIKYTNNKAKITLFTINKEKNALQRKYHNLNNKITKNLFTKYNLFYNNYLKKIENHLFTKYKMYEKVFFVRDYISKKKYIKHTFQYLNTFLTLNNLILKKIWSELIQNQGNKYLEYLRKYNLLYSLNQFKFNKYKLLPKLTYLLDNFLGKKIQYNIINLKSITYHPDLFTNLLALRIEKDRRMPASRIQSVLHKAHFVKRNTIQERSKVHHLDKLDIFRNNYRDLKIISHMKQEDLSSLVTNILNKIYKTKYLHKNSTLNSKKIHNLIFNSIGYKHLSGIKLRVAGRLTKRYRADRAIQSLNWKGGLKNIDSSFKGLSAVSFRGNDNSNVSYSLSASKRRIGSFAVKGWIGGK